MVGPPCKVEQRLGDLQLLHAHSLSEACDRGSAVQHDQDHRLHTATHTATLTPTSTAAATTHYTCRSKL